MAEHTQATALDVATLLTQAASIRRQGDIAGSDALFDQAARTQPNTAQLQYDLALARLDLGHPATALPYLDRAIALDPGFGPAHLRRGNLLEALSLPGAADAYLRAIEAAPDLAEAYARIAALRNRGNRRDEAIRLYHEAARRTPDPQAAGIYRARASLVGDDLDAAEASLRQVLTINADAYNAVGLLAHIQKLRGDFAAAEVSLTKALQLRPAAIDLYYELVHTRKIRPDDAKLIDSMRDVLSWIAPAFAQVRVRLALAKALDDIAEYQEAASHLQAASALQARHFPIDRRALESQVDHLIGLFTADWLAQAGHQRNPSARPIMVLGMPRSGTTLTEQILSSHKMVAGGGELHFWAGIGQWFLLRHGPDPIDTRGIAEPYLTRLQMVSATAERVVDKNPFNFMWTGLVHLVFPNARIVHCRRHPADTCLSAMLADITQPRFSNAVDDLAFYYRQYQRIMAHWRSVIPADRFLDLDYERLVDNPATQIPSLVAFCGLPWDDACLTPERNSRVVKTSSVWQARQPIYRSSAGRRVHYQDLLRPFEALTESG